MVFEVSGTKSGSFRTLEEVHKEVNHKLFEEQNGSPNSRLKEKCDNRPHSKK